MSRRNYPRTARVNEVLREVIAEYLETVLDDDERLALVTITGVEADREIRHATVYYTGRHPDVQAALEEHRVRLQAAIGRETRLRRTPQLSFMVDPAVVSGERVEEILRQIREGQAPGDADC